MSIESLTPEDIAKYGSEADKRELAMWVERMGGGRMDFESPRDWFHRGQLEAWNCVKQIILILAGTQSGKTVLGPWWLLREIQRRGPGDYAIVGPTFTLLYKRAVPEFRRIFEYELKLGKLIQNPIPRFEFNAEGLKKIFGKGESGPVTIYLGYGSDSTTLEAMTLKGVWCDESGQPKFMLESKEALDRRVARFQGRILHTTTPYDLGWLKTKIWDLWKEAKGDHATIDVVSFTSGDNPTFPKESLEKARIEMQPWKFKLFYLGIFTRPAGAIYDTYDEAIDCVKRFKIPDHWPRLIGLDFGDVNTAAFFIAADPKTLPKEPHDPFDPTYYVYRTYHTGGKTASEHAASLLKREPYIPPCVGGARSEDEWRDKYSEDIYVSRPTISDVEVGIDAFYGLLKRHKLKIFDDLNLLKSDITDYTRELDENGEPTKNIKDKSKYHRLDAGRYILSEVVSNPAILKGCDVIDSLGVEDDGERQDYI